MRLPWVSRLAYDIASARADTAERRAADAESRYHELVARIGKQEKLPPVKDPEPVKPDLIQLAIGQYAERDPGLARQLSTWAQMERAKQGVDPNAITDPQILTKILHWEHTPSDGVPDGFWPEGEVQ